MDSSLFHKLVHKSFLHICKERMKEISHKIKSRQYQQVSCRWNFSFGEMHCGKAVVAYTKPQQRKKEETERLTGERDQIKFIDLRFERWQVVRFRKARRKQDVP